MKRLEKCLRNSDVLDFLKNHKKIKRKDLTKLGFYVYDIKIMVEQGILRKVGYGMYQLIPETKREEEKMLKEYEHIIDNDTEQQLYRNMVDDYTVRKLYFSQLQDAFSESHNVSEIANYIDCLDFDLSEKMQIKLLAAEFLATQSRYQNAQNYVENVISNIKEDSVLRNDSELKEKVEKTKKRIKLIKVQNKY